MQLRRKTTIIIGALMVLMSIYFDALGATTYPAGTNVPNTFFFTNTFRSNTVFQSTLQLNEMTRPPVSSSNSIYMWVEDMDGLPALRVRDWKGLVLGVVRDNVWIGRCATPGGILKGDAVYCAGTANSNMVWIAKAKADSRATMPSVGLATENIAFLAAGRILNNGLLPEVDTTNWNTGDILYVSDTVAGGLTNVIPVVPSLMQQIGFVQVPNTNGSIQVEMGSLLNDATGTGQTNWYFGPYTTNILSYGGSKINGVGFTNNTVTGKVNSTNVTISAATPGDYPLFAEVPTGFSGGAGYMIVWADNRVTRTLDGSLFTNIQGSSIVGTITVSEIDAGTLVLTNASNIALTNTPYNIGTLGITVDGSGSVITTGVKGYLEVPYSCKIIEAITMCDVSGNAQIAVWRTNSSSFPPTSSGSIGTNTITGSAWGRDSTLTGWTTSLSSNDIIGFSVVGTPATITRATMQLKVTK